jgi:hypothetical protein
MGFLRDGQLLAASSVRLVSCFGQGNS